MDPPAKADSRVPPVVAEAVDAAHSAGLHYVSDPTSGIRRLRNGRGFRYVNIEGRPVRDPDELARIRALAIPPAWTDVWICSSPRGHIQAVGRDARRRQQYRYHLRWRAVRDETKFGQLTAFGEALTRIRRRVEEDLARPALSREKVLAVVVRLLDITLMRIGNEEYARANQSFGLTTLRSHHVDVSGHTLRFQFRGKSGKHHVVQVSDRRLARIVKACQDIPGHELFQYVDENGQAQTIDSADVNDYLRETAGTDFSAKVFRTWAGTVQALLALRDLDTDGSESATKQGLIQVVKEVAAQLGNTPAVCRKCYIHPAVIEGFQSGVLREAIESSSGRRRSRLAGLSPDERMTLGYLSEWQRRKRPRRSAGPKPSSRTS